MSIKTVIEEKVYSHWSKVTLAIGLVILGILIALHNAIELKLWLLWFNLALYSLHQFEEHSYPGHFKEAMNTMLSGNNQTPMNDWDVLFINVFYVWILGPILIVLYSISAIFPSALLVVIIVNTALHIGAGIRFRKYNPGLFFSLVVNLPVALYTAILFFMTMGPGEVAVAVVGGIIIHATVFIYIMAKRKKRLHPHTQAIRKDMMSRRGS